MRGKKIFIILGGLVCLLLVILWAGGFFTTGRIEPDDAVTRVTEKTRLDPVRPFVVELTHITDFYEAVGTVRPRTETKVEALVQAVVRDVLVTAGEKVKKGDTLIVLDDREFDSRLEQSRRALESAQASKQQAQKNIDASKAAFDKADAQYKRIKVLFAKKAVASSEMDQAQASYLQAEANLSRAQQGLIGAQAAQKQAARVVEQSEIAKDYTVIKALEDGEVVRRQVEQGDLAFPGKTLLELQTSTSMRLEAMVREGLIYKVRPGTELDVVITALNKTEKGVVEEVVPSADPKTRTFLVKVALPPLPGMYPGMFGRLLVPMQERETLLIPANAVRMIGQLETVDIATGTGKEKDDAWRTVYVKTGLRRDDNVEILTGLKTGETIALPAATTAPDATEGQ